MFEEPKLPKVSQGFVEHVNSRKRAIQPAWVWASWTGTSRSGGNLQPTWRGHWRTSTNNAFHPMASKYASLWWIVFQSKALSKFSINLEMPFVLQLTQLGRHLQTSYCISPKPQRSLNEPAVRLQCGGCECSSVAVVKFQCSRSEHSSVAVVNVPALQ